MENVQELMQFIEDNLLDINSDIIVSKFKDICLQNYVYLQDTVYQVFKHMWLYKGGYTNTRITLDMIRRFFSDELFTLIIDLQSKYIRESQEFEPHDNNHEFFQRRIKKIGEICICLRNNDIYKLFVDYYRQGYFN